MDAIRSSFTYDLINRTGSKCLSLSFAEVTKAMDNCKVSFHETMHECLEAIKMEATEMPKEDAIEAVRQKIMKKVFHARSNVEFQDYKSENIGRYAKKESAVSFRVELKAIANINKREGQTNASNETPNPKKRKKKEPSLQTLFTKAIFK